MRLTFWENTFWEKQIFSSGFSLETTKTATASRFDKKDTRETLPDYRDVHEGAPKTVADKFAAADSLVETEMGQTTGANWRLRGVLRKSRENTDCRHFAELN